MVLAADELLRAAVDEELVDAETIGKLRVECRRRRLDLLEMLSTRSRLPTAALYRAVARQRGLPFVDLGASQPDPNLVRRLPESLVRRRYMLPLEADGERVTVATISPDDYATLETIRRLLGRSVEIAIADRDSLELAIERCFESRVQESDVGDGRDAVALLERILKSAFQRRASDIHLEPQEDGLRVRLRIDGHLHEIQRGIGASETAGLISRVKVLAGLDIAEQRAPQDGGFTYEPPGVEGVALDIRVATIPSTRGERATLRLLGVQTADLTLGSLGLSAADQQTFREVIRRPHGMVLLTGPTGSGKTTTLYGALREINTPDINVVTVEDPVEYVIPGITQVQVGRTDKVTFAKALRSLLRHDPDVLMVGEIRDGETADVALKASLTGHRVFSTLHTNGAVGAITRLFDIGCAPFLVGSTLLAVIAQRLVRRLCPRCRRVREATPREIALLGSEATPVRVHDPGGCPKCLGTGYQGRVGLFECLWIDDRIGRLVSRGASEEELLSATAGSLTSLRDDGCAKVLDGTTTLDEVGKVTVLSVPEN